MHMGALFSKPLTREDLASLLAPITNDIALLKDDIAHLKDDTALLKDDMALVKDSLLAPDGDQVAKDVTVDVYHQHGSTVKCHGCLMLRGSEIYLVSAAHAIVDLIDDSTYSIWWSVRQECLFKDVKFDKVYIPKEYVLDGSNDVGIARLTGKRADNIRDQTKILQLSQSDGELVGKTVVGHGRVFLRGSVLSYPNENRIMIGTPSLSGCSGCPLIGGDKSLVAFVHGGVKHRGGRVLHNSGTDDVSGYLYADSIADVSFCLVGADHYRILQIAEVIEQELAARPTDEDEYKNRASSELKNAAPNASTLQDSMKILHDQIWPSGILSDCIKMDRQLQLLSHHTATPE